MKEVVTFMPATKSEFVAKLEAGRIILPTRFQAENLGFLRNLPGARWDKKRSAWSIVATPCTAARIVDRGYSADFDVCLLADEWLRGLKETEDLDHMQPAVRKTQARENQRRAFWFCRQRPASMLAVRMGKGKTKITIDLMVNWDCRRVLILCPKSVIGVWPREFERHGPGEYTVVPLDAGTSATKVARADAALASNPGRLAAVVVNYETAIQPAFERWATRQDWDLVVCDESHRIKQASGKASKFAFDVGQKARRRLALTGTPMPHSPLDLFAQCRFLDAGLLGASWVSFRQRYAVCSEQFKSQVLQWINQDELTEKFHQLAFIDNSIDDLDLPPVTHETINVTLSPEAMRVYRELQEELTVELNGKSIDALVDEAVGGEVTADNALVKLLRLQQIATGHVRTDNEQVVEIDRAKAEALADLLDGLPTDEPVVVFCPYRHNLQQIQKVAAATGRRYGEISGARKDLTPHATMPEDVDLMAVQWQAGSVGIDLTRARYGVIYSPTFNGGNFVQALARQHRPGQKRPTFFYHLIAVGTVDHAVLVSLKKRQLVTDAVLSGEEAPDAVESAGGAT